MTIDPATMLLPAAILFALATVLFATTALRFRPLRRRPAVIVALRSGESVRGILIARHPTYIELARVEVLHGAAGASSTVDGTLQVDRDNVTWVQVL